MNSDAMLTPGFPDPLLVAVSNTATQSQVRDCAPSIDWLTLAQVHVTAPLIGSSLLLFCDPATGEIESQAVKGLQFEGSFDSRLMVRSDGRRVEVSGNPSRFGRADNIFGTSDINACVELYNSVLRQLGLPQFAEFGYEDLGNERGTAQKWQLQGGSDETTVADLGVRVKRIDLCECYEVGNIEGGRASIRALGSVSHAGKPGFCYPDGNTVSWGQGSRYSYTKYYLKGPEMAKHMNQSDPYTRALTEWAMRVGLIRHEVSLKAMYLARNGLDKPTAWTHEQAAQIMKGYRTHDRAGLGASSYERIADELISKGVPAARARRAQEAAYAYLSGHQFIIGHNISRSAYYRLQGDLRKAGLNIGAPLNVSALRHSVRVVEWTAAQPPEFYRRFG